MLARMVASRLLTAAAGFLLAVLWMDLMFDVQVWGAPAGVPLPPEILASIGGYYSRVTTTSAPMSALIALVMCIGIGAALVSARRERVAGWRRILAIVLIAAPVALAFFRVLPNAVRLGAATDPPLVQSELARGILRDHLACFASIAALLVLRIGAPRPSAPIE
jgi:hypothetical protein